MANGTGFGKTIFIGDQFVLEEVPAIVSAISYETMATVERFTGDGWTLEDNRIEVPGYKDKKKEQQGRSIDRILEVMNIDVKKYPIKITFGGSLLAGSGVGASAASCDRHHPAGTGLRDSPTRITAASGAAYLAVVRRVPGQLPDDRRGLVGHAALTDRLARTDSIFLRLNLLLLLVVTFLPFPTGLVGEALREPSSERVFVTLYGLTLLAIRLLGFALDEYADREHLYAPRSDDEEQRERRQLVPVVAAYLIAILIGLAFPVLAVALYLGIAVYLVVPFREVSQLLLRRLAARHRLGRWTISAHRPAL